MWAGRQVPPGIQARGTDAMGRPRPDWVRWHFLGAETEGDGTGTWRALGSSWSREGSPPRTGDVCLPRGLTRTG